MLGGLSGALGPLTYIRIFIPSSGPRKSLNYCCGTTARLQLHQHNPQIVLRLVLHSSEGFSLFSGRIHQFTGTRTHTHTHTHAFLGYCWLKLKCFFKSFQNNFSPTRAFLLPTRPTIDDVPGLNKNFLYVFLPLNNSKQFALATDNGQRTADSGQS